VTAALVLYRVLAGVRRGGLVYARMWAVGPLRLVDTWTVLEIGPWSARICREKEQMNEARPSA